MDNCFKSIETIEAELDGICPRCAKKGFEKLGDSENSKLQCTICGLIIRCTTRHNQNVYVILALLMLIGVGLISWVWFLMQMASI